MSRPSTFNPAHVFLEM